MVYTLYINYSRNAVTNLLTIHYKKKREDKGIVGAIGWHDFDLFANFDMRTASLTLLL